MEPPQEPTTGFPRWLDRFLDEGGYRGDRVAWYSVGAFHASILGDIPVERRRELYYGALAQFVNSRRCAHWTDEDRLEALRLAGEALGSGNCG